MAPQESSCMGLAGETWGVGGRNGRLRGGGEGLTRNIPNVMFQGGLFFLRGSRLSFRKKIPFVENDGYWHKKQFDEIIFE